MLVGMMGAGKTAIGRSLALMLDVPFRDSDAEIEAAAMMSIAEIFDRDGEDFFRDRETQIIDRLLDDTPAILSAGGGAFLHQRNRDLIAAKGVAVWLRADLDLLWNRVKHKDTRPLLRTADPYSTLAALYEARLPYYEKADLVVQAQAAYSIETMAAKVRDALSTRADVMERVT
ncbi:MAG: shikimate kinase [Pseudomonadota bacterium]